MTKKYTFAILLNCSKIETGNHEIREYLVVEILFDNPFVFSTAI